jgi:hypothetical protein
MTANQSSTRRMSLQEARNVRYPFHDHPKEPMGGLIDRGIISFPELSNLIKNARVPLYKEAAQVLFDHLTEEQNKKAASSTGVLEVVSSPNRSYAEMRQAQLFIIFGFVSGIIITSVLFLWLLFALGREDSESKVSLSAAQWIIGLVIVVLMFIGFTFILGKVLEWITNQFHRQIKLYRQGQLGEERVLNIMRQVLNGNWCVFQNLEIPGLKHGDIDLVLVGPTGIWSFEVKALSGHYRNIGKTWQPRWGNLFTKDPGQQARRNAQDLHHFLNSKGLDKPWVQPIIIWANPDSRIEVENPIPPVWKFEQIADNLKTLTPQRNLSPEQREKMIAVLKEHYEKTTLEWAEEYGE